jgi:hypothetical protein
MDDQRADRAGGMNKLSAAVLVLVTAVGQAVIGFLLYRARHVSDNELWNSDFLVFFAPVLCAVAINTVFISPLLPEKWNAIRNVAVAFVLAAFLGIVAHVVCLIAAFNTYGT